MVGEFLRRLIENPIDRVRIDAAVQEAEKGHTGEIVVAVRRGLPRFAKTTPREEAVEVFATERVWDTEENNGVLIFVLLKERAIEIVADRGVMKKIPKERFKQICDEAITKLRDGTALEEAVESMVNMTGEELRKAFPGVKQFNQLRDDLRESEL